MLAATENQNTDLKPQIEPSRVLECCRGRPSAAAAVRSNSRPASVLETGRTNKDLLGRSPQRHAETPFLIPIDPTPGDGNENSPLGTSLAFFAVFAAVGVFAAKASAAITSLTPSQVSNVCGPHLKTENCHSGCTKKCMNATSTCFCDCSPKTGGCSGASTGMIAPGRSRPLPTWQARASSPQLTSWRSLEVASRR